MSSNLGYTERSNIKHIVNKFLDRFHLGASLRDFINYVKYITDFKLFLQNARFKRNGAPDGLPIQTPHLAYSVCGQYNLEAMYYNGRKGAE